MCCQIGCLCDWCSHGDWLKKCLALNNRHWLPTEMVFPHNPNWDMSTQSMGHQDDSDGLAHNHRIRIHRKLLNSHPLNWRQRTALIAHTKSHKSHRSLNHTAPIKLHCRKFVDKANTLHGQQQIQTQLEQIKHASWVLNPNFVLQYMKYSL